MTLLISHIPKTAGTSLRDRVCATTDCTLVYKAELALANPNLDFIRDFRAQRPPAAVMGHFSYGAHRFLGVSPRYATVLREPIARVVSLYRHQKVLPDSAFRAQLDARMTLRDFVASGATEMTNNHICRIAAGIAPEQGMLINERWLLDLALHNLRRHYVLIGTMERLPTFLAGLDALLGEGSALEYKNVGVGEIPDLDAVTLATIREHNALDIALYDALSGATGGA